MIAENVKSKMFTPAMPQNFIHTREHGITHPNGKTAGALLLNIHTGIYVLWNTGVINSVPQDWAREHDELNDIKRARMLAGISQAQMSKLLDIPLRTIENWETGDRKPPAYVEKLVIEKLERMKSESDKK